MVVIKKFRRKLKRIFKRWLRNRTLVLVLLAVLFVAGVSVYTSVIQDKRFMVDQSTYKSLLQLIGNAESNGNYNAYFGNASNQSIDFTSMSIGDVLQWQKDFVQQGNASSAVGRYQIIDSTLAGLIKQRGIDTGKKFDQATQDMLAIALLERRGSEKYINNEISREQFAANLAMEWAALPKVIGESPGDSYYAGDGLNKARVETGAVLAAIEPIKSR